MDTNTVYDVKIAQLQIDAIERAIADLHHQYETLDNMERPSVSYRGGIEAWSKATNDTLRHQMALEAILTQVKLDIAARPLLQAAADHDAGRL